jgi:hypothetical protein
MIYLPNVILIPLSASANWQARDFEFNSIATRNCIVGMLLYSIRDFPFYSHLNILCLALVYSKS